MLKNVLLLLRHFTFTGGKLNKEAEKIAFFFNEQVALLDYNNKLGEPLEANKVFLKKNFIYIMRRVRLQKD